MGDRIDFPGGGEPRTPAKKARGGKRPGAGRPNGAKNVLPAGAVSAIRSLNLRVPADASPKERELANRALERVADVMEDKVSSFTAFAVLTAAKTIREEICGPIAKKVQVEGGVVFRIEED